MDDSRVSFDLGAIVAWVTFFQKASEALATSNAEPTSKVGFAVPSDDGGSTSDRLVMYIEFWSSLSSSRHNVCVSYLPFQVPRLM
jgi:hypothetical protein